MIDDPFYAPDHTLTAPVSRPDERVWTLRRETVTWSCELHFRGENDGWEVQILRNGDLFVWQRFGSRELAQAWAEAERQILEKAGVMGGDADATLARLLEADRRFTEFSKQHLACRGDATLTGDHQDTIFRCLICGEVFAIRGLALPLYVDYLRAFKGATDLDLQRLMIAPGSDRPSEGDRR